MFQKESEPSEEDIDGAPIEEEGEEAVTKKEAIFDEEEDIDGVPIEEEAAVEKAPPKKTATFKQSQWNTVGLHSNENCLNY